MQKKLTRCILFFCLSFSLSAQNLIPNMPDIIGDTIANTVGYITGFEHDSATHKLYIAGEFQRVGTVNRQGLAVIDLTTGAVLNDLSFITLSDLSVSNHVKAKLKLYNHRLYICGAFISPTNDYLFSVNLNNNNVRSIYSGAPISDFEIYNSKLYASGAYYTGTDPQENDVNEMDTLGTILWQKSIVYSLNERLVCLDVKNNILCVGGTFTSFGGVSVKNVAKVDLSTHTVTNWTPSPLPGPSGNLSCFTVQDINILANDIRLNITTSSCANPPKNISSYDISTGVLNPNLQSIAFNYGYETLLPENDTSYWYSTQTGLKQYGKINYIFPWSPTANSYIDPFFRKAGYLFVGGGFTTLQGVAHKGLGVYCMKPNVPTLVSAFTKACQGQNGVIYKVTSVKDATSYVWSYTGSGVTINGAGNQVMLYFSTNATSGAFKVCAKSYCGTTSDTLYIPFTVYPLPNVNAGPDVRFTCSHNIDSLKGSSTTPGALFGWTGPSFSSNAAINQVTSSTSAGNYILWVTDPVSSCKKKDTAVVYFDTAAPIIDHNLTYGQITCNTSVVTLDAANLYPNTFLHWTGNSFSQNNPANVTVAGIYTLTITSNVNDCFAKDTFTVTSNTVSPNISAPLQLDTITCSLDSIQLPASSTTSSAILYWKDSNGDSILNNSYTHFSGAYTVHALDTINGCTSQLFRFVNQFTTAPVVQVPLGPFSINCSYNTAVLNGSSPNNGATLSWSGPSGFASANPATASQPGYYTLTVTNPQNGCSASDSVNVILQNTLVLTHSPDTLICNGSSATLTASPVGGTPPFTYGWNGGAGNNQTATVSPSDTTYYVATITDNAGCVGQDSVRVYVPSSVSDSVHTFQPCDPNNPNGQIQAYGVGGIPPYLFSLDTAAFQSSGIFTGLNYGSYTVTVKDSLGCITSFAAVIDQSSLLPAPDFLLSTTEIAGDTFVIVDISNPRPDSVKWILPTNCSIINTDMFAPKIIHADTGSFQVTLVAWFGTCMMQLTKNIVVILPDTSFANGSNNNGISDLSLYPNPNSGQFTVDITLYKKQALALFIFDGIGNEILRIPFAMTDHANAQVQLNNPAPGSYILKVIAQYDARTRTFLIEQH